MTIIPNGFGHIVFKFERTGDLETMVTTLGVRRQDGSDVAPTDAALINGAFTSAAIMTPSASDTVYRGLDLIIGTPGGPLTTPIDTAVSGGTSGVSSPQNTAYLVRKVTGLGGRKNRGRMYVPAVPPEGSISGAGVIDPTVLGNLATAWGDFEANLAALTDPLIPVLLHSDPLDAPNDIDALIPQSVVATQRRRLRR